MDHPVVGIFATVFAQLLQQYWVIIRKGAMPRLLDRPPPLLPTARVDRAPCMGSFSVLIIVLHAGVGQYAYMNKDEFKPS